MSIYHCILCCVKSSVMIVANYFTARKRSLGKGNVFTLVCHSVHRVLPTEGGESAYRVALPLEGSLPTEGRGLPAEGEGGWADPADPEGTLPTG